MHFETLLPVYGPWLIFAVVALESAGIPVPGETTLVAASLLAGTTHDLSIASVVLAAAAGAITGDNVGYWVGRALGRPLLKRYGRFIHIDEGRLRLGQYLFMRYGPAMVFFGRFIAVLRALAALLAGTSRMPWGRFLLFNAAGGICWASLFGFGTYLLGSRAHLLTGGFAGAIFVIAVVAAVLLVRRLRQEEERLQREADAAIVRDD
jgi:membrane protein DedA with SNARE-associated domain